MRELDTLVRARYPLIYLVSWEEQRLDAVLEELARTHGKALYAWSSTQGLRKIAGARYVPPQDGTRDPVEALAAIQKLTEPSLVVLKDFHPFLNDPVVVRWLRELAHHLKSTLHHRDPALARAGHPGRAGEGDLRPRRAAAHVRRAEAAPDARSCRCCARATAP